MKTNQEIREDFSKMDYKKVMQYVPWCYGCDQRISGNGSGTTPYKCECGEWVYDENFKTYKLNS